jgi:hypothetical protein
MKGLRGTPCSRSSCTIELNGVPEGSRPTRRQSVSPTLPSAWVSANTFETLWIENGFLGLAGSMWTAPSAVTTQSPNCRGSTCGERRDIGRDLAPLGQAPRISSATSRTSRPISVTLAPRLFRLGATAKPQATPAVKRSAKAVAAEAKLR